MTLAPRAAPTYRPLAMKKTTGTDRSITSKWRPATRAVRAGTWRSEHGETSEALFLTSGYTYENAASVAARFAGGVAQCLAERPDDPGRMRGRGGQITHRIGRAVRRDLRHPGPLVLLGDPPKHRVDQARA